MAQWAKILPLSLSKIHEESQPYPIEDNFGGLMTVALWVVLKYIGNTETCISDNCLCKLCVHLLTSLARYYHRWFTLVFWLNKNQMINLSMQFHTLLSKYEIKENIKTEWIWATTWQNQQNECAPSKDSDRPGHPPSLIRVFTVYSMGS